MKDPPPLPGSRDNNMQKTVYTGIEFIRIACVLGSYFMAIQMNQRVLGPMRKVFLGSRQANMQKLTTKGDRLF